MMLRNLNRKGQEEIVGFVLIIILVSIMALVFLAISLRKTTKTQSSLEIEDFLQAIGKTTTECAINYEPEYSTLNDLVKNCINKESCISEKNSCDILNETLIRLIGESFPVGDNYPRSYYILKINYLNNTYYELEKGECKGSRTGAESFIPYSGDNIITGLEICSS